MSGRLAGKVAIVTGAASGIGAATAAAMAREGAAVVVADINYEPAEQHAAVIAATGARARAVRVDLGDEASIRAMIDTTVEWFGGLDILHNNAADTRLSGTRDAPVERVEVDIWDALMRVNLRGTMLATQHAIPRLRARGGGVILNTASTAGLIGMLSHTTYGVTKAGIIALTRYTATQHGKENIRCNAICPGLIVTPATEKSYASSGMAAMMLRHHLSPRLGRPEDVANAAVYLASDEAAFVTGQAISVDGGFLAHGPEFGEAMLQTARS